MQMEDAISKFSRPFPFSFYRTFLTKQQKAQSKVCAVLKLN